MELDGKKLHLYFYSLKLKLSTSSDYERRRGTTVVSADPVILWLPGELPDMIMSRGRSDSTEIPYVLITTPKL